MINVYILMEGSPLKQQILYVSAAFSILLQPATHTSEMVHFSLHSFRSLALQPQWIFVVNIYQQQILDIFFSVIPSSLLFLYGDVTLTAERRSVCICVAYHLEIQIMNYTTSLSRQHRKMMGIN